MHVYSLITRKRRNPINESAPALKLTLLSVFWLIRVITPGQNSPFRRNVAAVACCWQHYINLTDPRFEPQTYRSRDECITARPTEIIVVKRFKQDCVLLQCTSLAQSKQLYSMISFALLELISRNLASNPSLN